MTTKRLVCLAACLSVALLAGAGRLYAEGRGDGGSRGGGGFTGGNREESNFSGGGRSVFRMQNISMSRPERLEPARIVNDNRRIEEPSRFGNGEQIRARSARIPPAHHAEIMHNDGILRSIGHEQGAERARGRYYWHENGGRRYAHYFDSAGIDWYGFYFGPAFYWTRYYGDHWWWYDPGYARWVFWWNGYWWWQGPGGMDYVYRDNNYYPYEEGGITVQKSTTVAPVSPAEAGAVPGEGKQWTSPDLQRMVEVTGSQDAAFLYDRSTGKPVYMNYLGRDVAKVRFSGGVTGQPLQILLDFKDDTYALFDEDGKSVQPQPEVSVPPLPTLPPGSAPGPASTDTVK